MGKRERDDKKLQIATGRDGQGERECKRNKPGQDARPGCINRGCIRDIVRKMDGCVPHDYWAGEFRRTAERQREHRCPSQMPSDAAAFISGRTGYSSSLKTERGTHHDAHGASMWPANKTQKIRRCPTRHSLSPINGRSWPWCNAARETFLLHSR